jgi:thiosulfate dehydrogenase (quinone) large subunit
MSIKERPAASPAPVSARPAAGQWLAVLRISVGLIFVWAFADKLFGLGYSTRVAKSWLGGGSPTKGFLGNVAVGPFQSLFHAWAGAAWADWLFMLGLLGIGVAVTLGVALRLSAIAGTIMLVMMWTAEWPLSTTTAAGKPSGSTNPLIDYHIVFALVLIVAALFGAGLTWGLGRQWEKLAVVRDNPWLR